MNIRLICLLLSLFFMSVKMAEAQPNLTTNDAPTRLNHIALYVHDLSASTNFYKDILKLKIIPEPFKDGKHTWFSLGPTGQLHLIAGAGTGISYNKNSHLCFSVKSVEDFILVLDKNNIGYSNWPGEAKAVTVRVDGVKQVYFKDPDGYWIEVNDDYR